MGVSQSYSSFTDTEIWPTFETLEQKGRGFQRLNRSELKNILKQSQKNVSEILDINNKITNSSQNILFEANQHISNLQNIQDQVKQGFKETWKKVKECRKVCNTAKNGLCALEQGQRQNTQLVNELGKELFACQSQAAQLGSDVDRVVKDEKQHQQRISGYEVRSQAILSTQEGLLNKVENLRQKEKSADPFAMQKIFEDRVKSYQECFAHASSAMHRRWTNIKEGAGLATTHIWSNLSHAATAALPTLASVAGSALNSTAQVFQASIEWTGRKAWTCLKNNTGLMTWSALTLLSTQCSKEGLANYPLMSTMAGGYLFLIFKDRLAAMMAPR